MDLSRCGTDWCEPLTDFLITSLPTASWCYFTISGDHTVNHCGLADLEILFHAATNHVVGLWNMTFIIQSKLWFPSIHYVLRDSSSNFGLFFHSSSCDNEVHYHKMHLSIQSIKWGWKATKQLPALDVTHQCDKERDYFYAVPQAAILMVLDTMATLKKTKFAV